MVGCGVVDCGVDGGTKEDGGLWDEVWRVSHRMGGSGISDDGGYVAY